MTARPHLGVRGTKGTGRSLASICPASCALAHERWPRWFPRQEFQTESRPYRGPLENAECFSSVSICSSSCKFGHQLSTVSVGVAPRVWLISGPRPPTRRAPLLRRVFARNHQFPGDASRLVGQCHGGQLRRLAFEELGKPRRRPSAALCTLDHGGRPTASTLRNPSSPARVIPPSLTLPAIE
jgi:hypothetical protein